MLSNFRIENFASVGLQSCESAFLINTDQSAVASHVRCKDSRQAPFCPFAIPA
jgi:hypothetical protein